MRFQTVGNTNLQATTVGLNSVNVHMIHGGESVVESTKLAGDRLQFEDASGRPVAFRDDRFHLDVFASEREQGHRDDIHRRA